MVKHQIIKGDIYQACTVSLQGITVKLMSTAGVGWEKGGIYMTLRAFCGSAHFKPNLTTLIGMRERAPHNIKHVQMGNECGPIFVSNQRQGCRVQTLQHQKTATNPRGIKT